MSRKTLGYILVAAGAVVVLVSVFADSLGLGAAAGFGWRQTIGAIVGVIIAVVGVWLGTRKPA